MNDDLPIKKETSQKLGNTFCFTSHKVVFMSYQLNTIFHLDILYAKFNDCETSR